MTTETNGPLVLRGGPGHARDGALALRISPEHADEVTGDLREAGFEPGEGLEFSEGPVLALFFVAFAQAGGIEQFARVITAILNRHDNKHFVVRGPGEIDIEADGYSDAQVRKLVETTFKLVHERDAQWQGMIDDGELTSNHQLRAATEQDAAAEPEDESEN